MKNKNMLIIVLLGLISFISFGAKAYDLKEFLIGVNQQNKQNDKQKNINDKIYSRTGIETSKEWNTVYSAAVESANALDKYLIDNGQDIKSCNINYVANFGRETNEFDRLFGDKLPNKQKLVTKVLDVNSFKKLNEFYYNNPPKITAVYIPSVVSVGVAVNGRRTELNNANKNMSAIMLPEKLMLEVQKQYVLQGRTPEIDALNLHEATMKDISNVGYFLLKNNDFNIRADEFVKDAMLVYARNKMMCLYNFVSNVQ